MSRAYVSADRLRQFIENIATAEVKSRDEVDYLLAVKNGRFYRVVGAEAPYLFVEPKDAQWVRSDADVYYSVESNTDWSVN